MNGVFSSPVMLPAVLAVLVTLIGSPTTDCAGSGRYSLKMLTDRADVILVADILQGSVSRDQISLTVSAVRVLKGRMQVGSVVTITSVDALRVPANRRAPDDDRGVFFLRSLSMGNWALLPPISGYLFDVRETYIPVPKRTPLAIPPGIPASVLDRVIAEASANLEDTGPQPPIALDIASQYRNHRSPAVKALLNQFRESSNPKLRVQGLRGAIIDGDEQALANIQQEVSGLSPGWTATVSEELRNFFASTSPRAIAGLGSLVLSSGVSRELRYAAATALARIHTRETLPLLATLLDDPDPALRARAVGGLAMFANNVPVGQYHPSPGQWKYRTEATLKNSVMDQRVIHANPAVVSFWKAWWNEHRRELETTAP